MFKGIFTRAAGQLAIADPNAAADLRRASAHWLLHTFANHGLDAGADIRDMQELLGHASLGNTTHYTKEDATRQFQSVEAFFNAALDGANPPEALTESMTSPPAAVTVPATSAPQMVDVHVTLRIAPKRAGGRGQARVLERVEREVLAGVPRASTRDGVTVLQVPFDNDDAFDRRVDDLLVAIAQTAEQHRRMSETICGRSSSPASAGAGTPRRRSCRPPGRLSRRSTIREFPPLIPGDIAWNLEK
ncbi:tyrosine-type recombinase/integrase [Burkholderia cepacia]|uniref:tyrosine-type recombinase/integrase n=1 Tax=Burkholderia cepacia TaxID=292 RepID=UPI001FC8525B|nr:tyrosine-type recombinase/integrase [Burkholderia cepacia]